jgi:heterodisulfide reductase subunit A2
MDKEQHTIGVFINNGCGTSLSADDAGQIADSVFFSGLVEKKNILFQKQLGKRGIDFIKEESKKRGFTKIVIAGYSPTFHEKSLEEAARSSGVGYGAVKAVPLFTAWEHADKDGFVRKSSEDIIRAVRAVNAVPVFEEKEVELTGRVLVVGGGPAGIETASACSKFGYEVIVIEQSSSIGGDMRPWSDIPVTVKTRTSLIRLAGSVGNYTAVIETAGDGETKREEITVGAVIVTAGLQTDIDLPPELHALMESPFAEPMDRVAERIKSLTVRREVRNVGLLLDVYVDETKASTEMALTIAKSIQEEDRYQVHIFLRDVRVAAKGLQQYYDAVRDSGVNIVKYDAVEFLPDEEGIHIQVKDSVLLRDVDFFCDIVGISGYGLPRTADRALLDITGILPDKTGMMQENNIHLFSVETNRPGIFVAGAARGTLYVPRVIEEARAAAMSVHGLLGPKTMKVICSEVQVDPDKCVLCLTCIRCCPYNAMHIDRENSVAVSYPEECQKCGICAGECPAKAITLPEYSDEVIMLQL